MPHAAARIRQGREEQRHGFEDVQIKLEEMNRAVASLTKPREVGAKISALKAKMLMRADEAEADYGRGYASACCRPDNAHPNGPRSARYYKLLHLLRAASTMTGEAARPRKVFAPPISWLSRA